MKIYLTQILKEIKQIIFHRSFLIGFIVAIGFFSHYIFGDDNLYEQVAEKILLNMTGFDINFNLPLWKTK